MGMEFGGSSWESGESELERRRRRAADVPVRRAEPPLDMPKGAKAFDDPQDGKEIRYPRLDKNSDPKDVTAAIKVAVEKNDDAAQQAKRDVISAIEDGYVLSQYQMRLACWNSRVQDNGQAIALAAIDAGVVPNVETELYWVDLKQSRVDHVLARASGPETGYIPSARVADRMLNRKTDQGDYVAAMSVRKGGTILSDAQIAELIGRETETADAVVSQCIRQEPLSTENEGLLLQRMGRNNEPVDGPTSQLLTQNTATMIEAGEIEAPVVPPPTLG